MKSYYKCLLMIPCYKDGMKMILYHGMKNDCYLAGACFNGCSFNFNVLYCLIVS